MSDIEYKIEKINCPTRELSDDVREYLDKEFGRPCTDMYDFIPFSEAERKEKGAVWGWTSKLKENITDDQKIRRKRAEYPEPPEPSVDEHFAIDNLLENTMVDMVVDELTDEISFTIRKKGDN